MLEKVRCQIMLEAENYDWITTEMYGRHHKNLSKTVNEILKNYQILIKSIDKERERAEREQKAREEIEKVAQIYRAKAIE